MIRRDHNGEFVGADCTPEEIERMDARYKRVEGAEGLRWHPAGWIEQAKSFTKAVVSTAVSGPVSQEIKMERLELCEECEMFSTPNGRDGGWRCRGCGCSVDLKQKAAMSGATCPLGKWSR